MTFGGFNVDGTLGPIKGDWSARPDEVFTYKTQEVHNYGPGYFFGVDSDTDEEVEEEDNG